MPHKNAMGNEEVNKFRESQEILDKLFKLLFAIIALKTSDMGEALFLTHHNIMMVVVLMIVLYFLVWLLGTLLPHPTGIFLSLSSFCFIMVIGSICSVLLLTILSPDIAWLTVLFWVGIFAATAYYSYKELYNLAAIATFDVIKVFIDSYRRQSTELPV